MAPLDLGAILEDIDEVVYVVWLGEDPMHGEVEFVSGRAEAIAGTDARDFQRDPGLWMSLLHPDDVASVHASTQRMLAECVPVTREYRLRDRRTGEYRWVEDRVTPELDQRGRVVAFIGAARDVSDRKRAEQDRREVEERFRTVVAAMDDVVFTLDREQRHTGVYGRWLERGGMKPDDFLGKTAREILGDDAAPLHEAANARSLAGESLTYEWSVAAASGSRDFSTSLSPIRDAEGRVTGIVGVGREVTDRKNTERALRLSEEKFSKAFLASPEILAVIRLDDGTLLEINEAVHGRLGYRREELMGRSDLPLWADPLQRDRLLARLRAEGRVRDFDVEARTRAGEARCFLVSAETIEVGGTECALTVARDVTESRRAENALRQLSSRLLQSQDEERRRLARELHDSMGQQLAGLSLQLATLRRVAGRLAAPARRALGEAEVIAEQCSREVRTLSYLLHPPLLEEAGLTVALRWLVDGFTERSGVRTRLQARPGLGRLPPEIEIAVFRIVQECLANVHRHSRSRTARVGVVRREHDVCVEVCDRGRGLLLEGGAPGVGMAGMRERARELGGSLEVVSSRRGTTVRACLPLRGEGA